MVNNILKLPVLYHLLSIGFPARTLLPPMPNLFAISVLILQYFVLIWFVCVCDFFRDWAWNAKLSFLFPEIDNFCSSFGSLAIKSDNNCLEESTESYTVISVTNIDGRLLIILKMIATSDRSSPMSFNCLTKDTTS